MNLNKYKDGQIIAYVNEASSDLGYGAIYFKKDNSVHACYHNQSSYRLDYPPGTIENDIMKYGIFENEIKFIKEDQIVLFTSKDETITGTKKEITDKLEDALLDESLPEPTKQRIQSFLQK